MYTLFLDTHDKEITVSFLSDSNTFTKTIESESHSIYFLPLLDEMIKENKIDFKDIKNIVVVNGPGSFTGVRIGLTVAKTISYCMNAPIYLISSLKAYLISNAEDDNNISVIEDSKGFYVGTFNEEVYVESLEDYKDNIVVENKLDIKKIVEYALNTEAVNVHAVKANYVKVIEALK